MGEIGSLVGEAWRSFHESEFWRVFSSYDAQRSYAFIVAIVVISGSSYLGLVPFRRLHNETKTESLERTLRYRGRRPTTEEGKARRRNRQRRDAKAYATKTLMRILVIFVLGVIIPLGAVMAISVASPWLFPDGYALVDRQSLSPVIHPDGGQLVLFGLDLLAKGGLNDFFEVFDLRVGQLGHSPDNYLFSGYILVFRLVADLFVISLLVYAIRTFWAWRQVTAELDEGAEEDPDITE